MIGHLSMIGRNRYLASLGGLSSCVPVKTTTMTNGLSLYTHSFFLLLLATIAPPRLVLSLPVMHRINHSHSLHVSFSFHSCLFLS